MKEPLLVLGSSSWVSWHGGDEERGNENRQRLVDQRFSDPAPFAVRGTLTGADGVGAGTATGRVAHGAATSGTTGFIALVIDSCRQTARWGVEASSRAHLEETSKSRPRTLSLDMEGYDDVQSESVYSHVESTC